MAKTRFTNDTLRKLQSGDWSDTRHPNLIFRVGQRARTWIFRPPRRADGSRPGTKLGRFPEINLETAIRMYDDEKGRIARGDAHPDPDQRIRELEAELRALKRASGRLMTVGDLAERFLADYVPRSGRSLAPSTWRGYNCALRKHVLPLWADRDIEQLEDVEIEQAVNDLGRTQKPTAIHVLRVLKTMFNWGARKKLIVANPCQHIIPPPSNRRTRVLSPEEIRAAWEGFSEMKPLSGQTLRLLLLTWQRRCEVTEMTWSEVNDAWWTLSESRAKNRQPHLVFLAPTARDLIDRRRDVVPRESHFVFPGRYRLDRPLAKATVSWHCKLVSERLTAEGKIKAPFTVHDLRRTAATTARSIGADRRVVKRILNHKSSSVTDVYDLYSMKPEVQEVLTLWDEYITDLVGLKRAAA